MQQSSDGVERARKRDLVELHTLCDALGGEQIVQQLSREFYQRLRSDTSDRAFHQIFTRQGRSLDEVVRNQSSWFIEMWSNNRTPYTDINGDGMLMENLTSTKHTRNMQLPWLFLWLDHMDAAMRSCLPRETRMQRRAAITVLFFFRHFCGFFPMALEERRLITERLGVYAGHWVR